jgi:hypothetical protein
MSSIRVGDPREGKIMKITKAEGYKKPNYAVAVAAAMTIITVGGCGGPGPQLEGEATLAIPPEEQQVVIAGEVAEPVNDVIELDGYVTPYVDEEVDIDDSEDKEVTEEDGEIEDGESEVFCEPIEDDLMLSGSVEVYEP